MADLSWHRGAELPSLYIWWHNADGALLDLSDADDIEVRVGQVGEPAVLVKSTGITGAAGSGVEGGEDAEPNLTIAWGDGDLDLDPGTYTLHATATFAGLDRVMQTVIRVLDIVAEPVS